MYCNCLDCRHYGSERTGHAPVLPADGERLTFGVHRLAGPERRCPAWPSASEAQRRLVAATDRRDTKRLGDPKRDPRYIAWVQGVSDVPA